ncbi:MAG: Na/Pi cotransporter family protein [Acidaminococcaceae bacterium]|jgi:phosphate:Na+ symporter|nr:Na/Pi cotransporter family protein [Acidaminococcaceae bacterium]
MLIYLFAFLGGLALFLYGMQLMGEGLQRAAGAKLQKILEALTSVTIFGVLLGAGVTAILQSSSATTVMTVGLVNAGLMTLKQAFGIVMGANIGTTMTAQLIAFKLTDYITFLLFVGFILQAFGRRRKVKNIGHCVLGFGILMLGMGMMSQSVSPLRNYPGLVEFIQQFSAHPLIGLCVGLCMTLVIQSSSATIGILMAMAGQGLIPLEGAIPVLLGDNIGTCITAILATLRSNLNAKRVALSHVMFNLIGSLIFMLFLPHFIKFVLEISPANDIGRQIANAHTSFNVINTLLFLPFAGKFTDFIKVLMPGEDVEISFKPKYLDKNVIKTPAIAMTLANKEVVRMGQLSLENIAMAFECINNNDIKNVEKIKEHEQVIDNLEEEITVYLTKLSEQTMTKDMSAKHTGLLHVCSDIERIGDHAEIISKRVKTMLEDGMKFSPQAQKEMHELADLVYGAVSKSMSALETGDRQVAEDSLALSKQVVLKQKAMRKSHVKRLNDGICNPETGFAMLEIVINMKRVSDHSKNISQLVLGEF